MQIAGSVALVTGANRGIGRHFATALLERGAARVYATARDPRTVDVPGAEVLRLDVTDRACLTNGIRLELAGQRTLVTALHVGSVDTDMSAGWDGPKQDPAEVVRAGLDGLEADRHEVVVDDFSAQAEAALAADPGIFRPGA